MIRQSVRTSLLLASMALPPSVTAQTSVSLFSLDGAAHSVAIREALEQDRRADAYLHARAWRRMSPADPSVHLAMASVYLAFDAPAATLEALDHGLRLTPGPAEEFRLRTAKVQAHAALGENAAAWANARALLANPDLAPDDPIATLIREVRWSYYADLVGEPAVAAHAVRSGGIRPGPPDPLLPETLAAAQAATPLELLRFDTVIAQELITTEQWEERLAAAETAGAWNEAVWSAFRAYHRDPARLDAWFAPRIAANDLLIRNACHALLQGSDDSEVAFNALLAGLERDPAHREGLTTLMQVLLRAGRDEAACDALKRLWALDLPDFQAEGEALALALRLGEWAFLLELSDHRLSANDADAEGHFHRAVASAALALPGLAADSGGPLASTPYRTTAALVQSVARGLDHRPVGQNVPFDSELKAAVDTLGTDAESPGARVWLALAFNRRGAEFVRMLDWTKLEDSPSPSVATHLDFIRRRLAADEYLATHRGTDEAPVAEFLDACLTHLGGASPAVRERLAASATDPALPFLLRLAANRLLHAGEATSPASLRSSSRRHLNPRTREWRALFESLAPGQTLLTSVAPRFSDVPGNHVLRVVAPAGLTVAGTPTPNTVGPLWEIEGLTLTGRHAQPVSWSVAAGHVLAFSDGVALGHLIDGQGHVWIENADLANGAVSGARLKLANVFARTTLFDASRSLDTVRLIALDPVFRAGIGGPARAAQVVFIDALIELKRPPLVQGGSYPILRFFRTTIMDDSTPDVGPFELGGPIRSSGASRILGFQPTDGDSGPLERFPFANRREVTDMHALRTALATARPGDLIAVAPGNYILTETLKVPGGVALIGNRDDQGRPASVFTVNGGVAANPLVQIDGGVARVANLRFVLQTGTTVVAGKTFKIADSVANRRALVASNQSFVHASNLEFDGWDAVPMARHAILADRAHIALTGSAPRNVGTANGGRITFLTGFAGPAVMSGQGDFDVPFTQFPSGALRFVGGVRFHGRISNPRLFEFENGAVFARYALRQQQARRNLQVAIETGSRDLARGFELAGSLEERVERMRQFSGRLAFVMRTAKAPSTDIVRAFQRHLTPILMQRRDELPFYFSILGAFDSAIPFEAARNYLNTFPADDVERVRAYTQLSIDRRRDGPTGVSGAEQRRLAHAFLGAYPPGHPMHARAMSELARGASLETFRQTLAREIAERARLARQAEAQRQAMEAYEARRKAELEAARMRRARLAAAPVASPVNWGAGWSSGGGSSGYTAYQPSASRQLQDYRSQLNNRIHNVGRDYGQGRRY